MPQYQTFEKKFTRFDRDIAKNPQLKELSWLLYMPRDSIGFIGCVKSENLDSFYNTINYGEKIFPRFKEQFNQVFNTIIPKKNYNNSYILYKLI